MKDDILCSYLFDLAMTLKCSVKIILEFSNENLRSLLHVVVTDIEHYTLFQNITKHASFIPSAIEIQSIKSKYLK